MVGDIYVLSLCNVQSSLDVRELDMVGLINGA